MQSPESTVNLTVEAYGRFMYTYCLAGGNITYHGLMCRANGTVVAGDTTTEIVDMRHLSRVRHLPHSATGELAGVRGTSTKESTCPKSASSSGAPGLSA